MLIDNPIKAYIIEAEVNGIKQIAYAVTSDNLIAFDEYNNEVTVLEYNPLGMQREVSFVVDLRYNESAPETFKKWLNNKEQRARCYNF